MFINKVLSVQNAVFLTLFLIFFHDVYAQDRSWEYSYNQLGKKVYQDGPRKDVNDTTTFTYDDSGNLRTIRNALGHTVTYQDYNKEGFPLSITGENGVSRELSYNWHGDITESLVRHPSGDESRDRMTVYEYDAARNMIGVTGPGKSTMRFEYDTADRLSSAIDNYGNRIDYTLDDAGNRVETNIRNSSGIVTYSMRQSFDALNQVMDIAGNNAQHIHLDRDANGNRILSTDGRNNSTQRVYDAMDRVSQVVNPAQGETSYTYNGQGQIKTVTDPEGLVTSYEYDGLGNLVRIVSPDTGVTMYTYDEAGNRTSSIGARGTITEYHYDALNRIAAIHYPDQPEYNVQYHYDDSTNGNYGIGRLTGLTDASGHTAYHYNPMGQVVEKKATVEGLTLTVRYQYDIMGRVSRITYPSGRQIRIDRDPQGRPDRILAQQNSGAVPQPLMEQARYLPFGPLAEYTYGNELVHQRTYDLDYRLSQLEVGDSSHLLSRLYEYDPVNNITGIHKAQASGESESYTYDSLNRLTDALNQERLLSYSYDPVGNRTEHYRDGDIETYFYGPDSHRLEARDNTQYQYDAAGNTLDNGEYRFRYSVSNRLIEVRNHSGDATVAEYRHNALGQRVLKRAGQATPDYLTLAQEEEAKAEQHRQAAQDAQARALSLRAQAEDQRSEANTLTTQAVPLREQADAERAHAERHTTQAEQLDETAAQLIDEAAKFRTYIVEPAGSFWERLRYVAYTAAAAAAEDVARQLSAEAANQRIEAEHRLAGAVELEQQARDLEGQAETLIAAAQNAETNADSLEQQATDRLAQALTAEANAQEYRQLAENTTSADAQQNVYLYNETGQLLGEYDESGTAIREYIYRDTTPLALVTDDQVYYYHNDHLATPKLLTDADQNIVWQAKYTPFGKAEIQTERVSNNLRFPGQYFDVETGLHYNYFRDYDPGAGRYVQSDPIGLKGGISTYGYVGSNPIKSADLLGLAYSPWGEHGLSRVEVGLALAPKCLTSEEIEIIASQISGGVAGSPGGPLGVIVGSVTGTAVGYMNRSGNASTNQVATGQVIVSSSIQPSNTTSNVTGAIAESFVGELLPTGGSDIGKASAAGAIAGGTLGSVSGFSAGGVAPWVYQWVKYQLVKQNQEACQCES